MTCSMQHNHQSSDDLDFLHQEASQWRERINKNFTSKDREKSVILFGGLSLLQDQLITAALETLDGNYINLPNPDFESFQKGKAYGNRGQCNPTYFTVGNLIKYLQNLRDKEGLSREYILEHYSFITAGGCGPCRFGMYITEYRKSLRDAGFEGFRIFSFEHDKGIFREDNDEDALNFTPMFFVTLAKAIVIGDIINMLTYKIRPYELEVGATDRAIEECRAIMADAFMHKKSLIVAMYRCQKVLKKVKLNRLQPKPKVLIIGEFWAAMTEGDGNYNLHRFLEAQGAECVPHPVTNRLMLSLWEEQYAKDKRASLEVKDGSWIDFSLTKKRTILLFTKLIFKAYFKLYAKAIGLNDYEIPNMEKLVKLSKAYYPIDASGGEGYLEVAHLIESIEENTAHLVISVKPFGCMPSSAVSDGIQSLVTSRFPQSNFLSIETSGEGAVNFYSRVQMALFKAKQLAKEEFEALTIPTEIPKKINDYRYQPKGGEAGSAALLIGSLK